MMNYFFLQHVSGIVRHLQSFASGIPGKFWQ